MLNEIITSAIQAIHMSIILLVIGVPLTDSPYLLALHVIFVPFLILHWVTNNNTCVLTTAEKFFKNVKNKEDEEKCFTCRLINPIFDFSKNNKQLSFYIYSITIGMWLVSIIKLSLKFQNGEITKLTDVMKLKK